MVHRSVLSKLGGAIFSLHNSESVTKPKSRPYDHKTVKRMESSTVAVAAGAKRRRRDDRPPLESFKR